MSLLFGLLTKFKIDFSLFHLQFTTQFFYLLQNLPVILHEHFLYTVEFDICLYRCLRVCFITHESGFTLSLCFVLKIASVMKRLLAGKLLLRF